MIAPVERCARVALRVINTPKRCAQAVVGLWVLCSLTYAALEGQGPIEGLWWGIVTASTVGYGDYSPETTAGRFVGMLLIVGMWFLTLAAAALYTARAVEDRNAFTHEEQVEMQRVAAETLAIVERIEAARVHADTIAVLRRVEQAQNVYHRETIKMIQAHSALPERTARDMIFHAAQDRAAGDTDPTTDPSTTTH